MAGRPVAQQYRVGAVVLASEAASVVPLLQLAVNTINQQNLLSNSDTLSLSISITSTCDVASGQVDGSRLGQLFPGDIAALLVHTCSDHTAGIAPHAAGLGIPLVASRATASFFSTYPLFFRTCYDAHSAIAAMWAFFQV
jgi:ABC-type branched-subunit amino acid transport system substrate-binding protein